MDVILAKTFLEVVSSGSFISAAKRLFVTQSAVSLRIQKLEDELGHKLFERSKGGVELTPYGFQFENYARDMIQIWEEARYQIAVPDGYKYKLSVGSQYSLWPELASSWLEVMERDMPDVSLNAYLGMPDRLTRLMINGIIDLALVYTPELRPGLNAEHLKDDRLVMVSGKPKSTNELDEDYVYMDWGSEFAAAHSRWYPDFRLSRTTLMVGAAAIPYLIRNGKSAFLPYRVISNHTSIGELHLVPDSPEYPFPVYVIWTNSKPKEVLEAALGCLRKLLDKEF